MSSRLLAFARTRYRLTGPLALAIGVAGCGDMAPVDAPMVYDSAGIEIVENIAPRLPDTLGWHLTEHPDLVIGSADGEGKTSLYRVLDVARLSDGRIAAVDGGDWEVRVFDPAGAFLFAFGREGEGPGEFRGITELQTTPGDTLLVFDYFAARLTIVNDVGDLVRIVQLRPPDPGGGVTYLGRLPDGSHVTRGGRNAMYLNEGDGLRRGLSWVVRLDPSGASLGKILENRGGESLVLLGGGMSSSMQFGRSAPTVLAGDQIVYGFAADYALEFYDLSGEIRRIARRRFERVPVTDAEKEAYIDSRRASFTRFSESDVRAMIAGIEFPEAHPVFEDFMVDREMNIWVEPYRPRGSAGPLRWSVFDRSGAWVTDIDIPNGFTIEEIGGDYMLGTARDTMGVQYVHMYGIEK